ncbi:hypothetical protein N780_17295 [Pontibacillus chungwhensis BH030062]|uniref:Uncharacterized protein n=1 Tax=Pontibacillus chungwhensis BH030062 TaxID=1385513 RepID=A0A0A2UX74_9BACI|nr:hypothetical protein N780_17295 [Pontibacillus chungwhensis BH030062]
MPYRVTTDLLMRIAGPFTHLKDRACSGTARLPREKEPREDPAESEANEEASQLPAGKRVVPEQAQALLNVTAPSC